ncbi:hypothetical protein PENSPDRAFT_730589 [Peniophora sp. CONT]|nr:hypothetical protein PENSPDRAFT_730589 [Peniophora sp. CONT]
MSSPIRSRPLSSSTKTCTPVPSPERPTPASSPMKQSMRRIHSLASLVLKAPPSSPVKGEKENTVVGASADEAIRTLEGALTNALLTLAQHFDVQKVPLANAGDSEVQKIAPASAAGGGKVGALEEVTERATSVETVVSEEINEPATPDSSVAIEPPAGMVVNVAASGEVTSASAENVRVMQEDAVAPTEVVDATQPTSAKKRKRSVDDEEDCGAECYYKHITVDLTNPIEVELSEEPGDFKIVHPSIEYDIEDVGLTKNGVILPVGCVAEENAVAHLERRKVQHRKPRCKACY